MKQVKSTTSIMPFSVFVLACQPVSISTHMTFKNAHEGGGDSDEEAQVAVADPVVLTQKPKMSALIMHNDDYTTMDFVVWVLISILSVPESKAIELMLKIHHDGAAQVAILPTEIAQMKQAQIHQLAEQAEFPLLVTLADA